MKTVLEVVQLSNRYLSEKGVLNPRRQAEELVADVLGLKRMDLYMLFDKPLADQELEKCRSALKRRGEREPLQYIRGEVSFFDCSFQVTPDVLIPRQETEFLVEKVAERIEKLGLEEGEFWDLCCGSGCIGIAMKKRFPKLAVTLSDLSEEALKVAEKNAERNGVEVSCFLGDLFAPFHGKKAHVICCNPPYISEKEFESLEPEVRLFEPKGALVSGSTGLEIYKRISQEISLHLHSKGLLALEIGHMQAAPLYELFSSLSGSYLTLEQDLAGHDRFFFLEIE